MDKPQKRCQQCGWRVQTTADKCAACGEQYATPKPGTATHSSAPR
jgi:rRNA maturation endonuclease Nob1